MHDYGGVAHSQKSGIEEDINLFHQMLVSCEMNTTPAACFLFTRCLSLSITRHWDPGTWLTRRSTICNTPGQSSTTCAICVVQVLLLAAVVSPTMGYQQSN